MAAKNELSLPIFDGSKFEEWRLRLILILKLRGCSKVVELDEKPADMSACDWAKLDLEAQNLIFCGLANKEISNVVAETTARKMLMKLDARYLKKNSNQLLCRKRLLELKMKETENPLHFFSKFDKLVNELIDAGEIISEQEKMSFLFLAIPRELSHNIEHFSVTPADQKNTDCLKAKIISAFEKKKNDSSDLISKLQLLNLNASQSSNQKRWRGRGNHSNFSHNLHEVQSDFQGTSVNVAQKNIRDYQNQSTGWRGNSLDHRSSQQRGSCPLQGNQRGKSRGYQNQYQSQRGSFSGMQNRDKLGKGGSDCSAMLENKQRFMEMITMLVNRITNEFDSVDEKTKLISLKTSIIMAIECDYPSCVIYEFGSRVSGLSSSTSDYDFFVDLSGRMYWGTSGAIGEEKPKSNTIHDIEKIRELLREHREFTDIIAILTARVPILRFTHIPTDSPCDLSFRNGLCVENTKLISKYLRMNFKIRWLIVAVKHWAQVCGFSSSTMFTTYALTWMVLFYLMTKQLIPSVSCLMNLANPNQPLIDGWKFETTDNISARAILDSEDKLLQGFFGYYTHFNFNDSIVCPRTGSIVPKNVIAKCLRDQIPDGIKDYIKCSDLSSSDDKFDVTECCVQDPFVLSHNITRQVRPPVLKDFKKHCEIANIETLLWNK